MKKSLILSAIAATLALSSGLVMAEDNEMSKDQLETQQQVQGRHLMTQQEREEFRNKMRSAKSAEERQQLQQEQHERMKLRAKDRGVSLPDVPPAEGRLKAQKQDRAQGRQFMTQQEREEFRDKMRSAKSAEERQQIQQEHHEGMKLRAKERGVSLPDVPPAEGGLKAQKQDRVLGRQLMTQQEREEFRNKMRSANSAEERQQLQQEQHERMKLRAKERGLSMPENPPADGMGSGGSR